MKTQMSLTRVLTQGFSRTFVGHRFTNSFTYYPPLPFSFCTVRQNCITSVWGTTAWHRFTNHSSSLMCFFFLFSGRRKPHGLGLSPPSPPPPPPLLTQLAYDFQYMLTKGWVSIPSRKDTQTWLYLQIIYQVSGGPFVREQSQRAVLYTKLHVTPLCMGNRELANM